MPDTLDPMHVAQLLRRAFRIIRRNYGCPGPDGVAIRDIHKELRTHVESLTSELLSGTVTFAPGREAVVRTGTQTTSERNVQVYNIRERWLQCYLRLLIEPVVSAGLADAVYSYRRGRTRYDGLRTIVRSNPSVLLVLDVRNFFGSLSRSRALDILRQEGVSLDTAQLVVAALEYDGPGLPKGNSLSPMISNLYLKHIDALFESSYVRFSDDMFFGVPSIDAALTVERIVADNLAELNLELSVEKRRLFVSPRADSIRGEYPWFASA